MRKKYLLFFCFSLTKALHLFSAQPSPEGSPLPGSPSGSPLFSANNSAHLKSVSSDFKLDDLDKSFVPDTIQKIEEAIKIGQFQEQILSILNARTPDENVTEILQLTLKHVFDQKDPSVFCAQANLLFSDKPFLTLIESNKENKDLCIRINQLFIKAVTLGSEKKPRFSISSSKNKKTLFDQCNELTQLFLTTPSLCLLLTQKTLAQAKKHKWVKELISKK